MDDYLEVIKNSETMTAEEITIAFRNLANGLLTDPSINYEEACRIVKSNLGYTAGYCSNETRIRIEKDFNCIHPFMGSAHNQLSFAELIELGALIAHLKTLGRKTHDIHQQPEGDPF
jgi:hypothetical protein